MPRHWMSGSTSVFVVGHHRNALWSNSAPDELPVTTHFASSVGWARSDTSKSDTLVPCTRPWSVASWPDADHEVVVDGVEVARVAGDLQLAEHLLGRRGVGEIDGVEGVGLAEGDEVGDVARVAHRVDPFAPTEVTDLADLLELVAQLSAASWLTELASAPHGTPLVVAARSTPSCSLIENWFSR